jgi:hypothetical protein
MEINIMVSALSVMVQLAERRFLDALGQSDSFMDENHGGDHLFTLLAATCMEIILVSLYILVLWQLKKYGRVEKI